VFGKTKLVQLEHAYAGIKRQPSQEHYHPPVDKAKALSGPRGPRAQSGPGIITERTPRSGSSYTVATLDSLTPALPHSPLPCRPSICRPAGPARHGAPAAPQAPGRRRTFNRHVQIYPSPPNHKSSLVVKRPPSPPTPVLSGGQLNMWRESLPHAGTQRRKRSCS
jgi:hypothetical protein